jgi:formate dehydrogenase gamma subunit
MKIPRSTNGLIQPALVLLFLMTASLPALAQHPSINLFDKDWNTIDPHAPDSTQVPFSTKQTCGLCHDYDTITSGYHFQAGWQTVADTFGVARGRPWVLANGFMGGWYPYAFRQLAKKHNDSPDQIDLTVYDFVGFSGQGEDQPPCGACHPGGGGLEFDRNGHRYDEYLAAHPDLRDSLDGDYYRSQWDKSGVVEADCFICHYQGYNFSARIEQLQKGNYAWASIAATGIGLVSGSVKRGQQPTVVYNQRFFNEDGTITLDMSWPPPSENCVFCHGQSEEKKRGFTWDDTFNPDIHNEHGLSCSACHPAGIDHQFAISAHGDVPELIHLQNPMKGCRECHSVGMLGSAIPQHAKVRDSHINRLTCEACHIPELHRAAALCGDATTGVLHFVKNPSDAKSFADKAEWKPVYERDPAQEIYPLNCVLAVYWANRDADGLLYPLFLREHEAAWVLYADKVQDDNGDGVPEVNTREEILTGLQAFTTSLQGNRRFQRIHPVYLKGEKAHEMDGAGNLLVSDFTERDMMMVKFSINHNVAPAGLALGNRGCLECHGTHAHFFQGTRVTDMYGTDGMPVTKSLGHWFGCRPVSFAINSFYQRVLSPLVSFTVVLVVFLVTLHYHSYGPKRIPFVPFSGEVQRFSLLERGVHLFRLISFVILAGTGGILAFNLTAWQALFFADPAQLQRTHVICGLVFIVTTVMGISIWFKDAMFASYDKKWVRLLGGYLGYKGEVPAGRFNAGQKMFYWYTTSFGMLMSITGIFMIYKNSFPLAFTCIIVTLHALVAFILIAGVLAHAYLGTIANPGTWRVLVDGHVTREWAEHHHPQWYRKLKGAGKQSQDSP